jgi:hypothetical protein
LWKNLFFIIFSLDSNKILLDYTERRKAMNKRESKYKDKKEGGILTKG